MPRAEMCRRVSGLRGRLSFPTPMTKRSGKEQVSYVLWEQGHPRSQRTRTRPHEAQQRERFRRQLNLALVVDDAQVLRVVLRAVEEPRLPLERLASDEQGARSIEDLNSILNQARTIATAQGAALPTDVTGVYNEVLGQLLGNVPSIPGVPSFN